MNERAFNELLLSWNRHQDLRFGGAPLRELAESRRALDTARDLLR